MFGAYLNGKFVSSTPQLRDQDNLFIIQQKTDRALSSISTWLLSHPPMAHHPCGNNTVSIGGSRVYCLQSMKEMCRVGLQNAIFTRFENVNHFAAPQMGMQGACAKVGRILDAFTCHLSTSIATLGSELLTERCPSCIVEKRLQIEAYMRFNADCNKIREFIINKISLEILVPALQEEISKEAFSPQLAVTYTILYLACMQNARTNQS